MVTQFSPKYRYDPNAMVHSLYRGVAPGGQMVTRLIKPDVDCNRMEATRDYENGLERGQGGMIGHLIIGGMETTHAEMLDIMEAKKEEKWVPRKSGQDIAAMCKYLGEKRNDELLTRQKFYKNNPSEAPKKPVMFLPVGCKLENTPEPGLRIVV